VNRVFRGSLVATMIPAIAMVIGIVPDQVAGAAACTYTPNYYALGIKSGSNQYGAEGLISAHTESIPAVNNNFTDENVHAVEGSTGLEVGWYVGYGNQTGTYVTTPHAYATLNGPSEQDGPAISSGSDYWYTAWWSGDQENFRVDNGVNGSVIWNNTISASNSGPGTILAMGETSATSLPMGPSTLSALQQLQANGTWISWAAMTTCSDSPYTVSSSGATSVTNG
jgi:hypothetical protein